MQTLTAEEFKKKFGDVAASAFPQTQQKTSSNSIVDAFKGGLNYFNQGRQDAAQATNPIEMTEAGLKEGMGLVGAAFSPLAPITKPIGEAVNYAADKISDNPSVQQFAQSNAGQTISRIAEDVQNTSGLLSLMGGGEGVPGAARTVGSRLEGLSADTAGTVAKTPKGPSYIQGAIRDITPTSQAVINHQIAKAFEFAPGDLSKIQEKTGNDVGTWLSDYNLIGNNAKETAKNIKTFQEANYDAVRKEIGMVPTIYKQSQVPRYADALKAIEKQIGDTPGMETVWAQVKNMQTKEELTLDDVQAVKELLDDHFQLYKATGDVKDSISKQGVANMRSELKTFIEKQVEKNGGSDIRQLNNNVMTAKSISDAIETRAPKGLTAGNLKVGDLGIFGIGMSFGGPLGGAALLFGKKLLEAPTIRLRIAKYLDGVSDAKKAQMAQQLQQGSVPPELEQMLPTGENR